MKRVTIKPPLNKLPSKQLRALTAMSVALVKALNAIKKKGTK